MNACPFRSVRHQDGFVSIVAAIILLAAIIFILNQSLGIVTNTTNANQSQEHSVAAFFLAESGVERALSTVHVAASANPSTYTNATCCVNGDASCSANGGFPSGSIGIGQGSFSYSNAQTQPPTCGGADACIFCTVDVSGTVGGTARRIRAQFDTTFSDGAAGCDHGFQLIMPTETSTGGGLAGILTNIAWRASGHQTTSFCTITGSNASAEPGTCTTNATSCYLSGHVVSKGWELQRTGNYNSSSEGVFAVAATGGGFNFDFNLVGPPNDTLSNRSFAATAARFLPLQTTADVGYVGEYTDSSNTAGTSGTPSGILPGSWWCTTDTGTGSAATAAGADTLVYGLSIMAESLANRPSAVTLTSIAYPMYGLANMNNPDYLHSQTWVTHNPSFYPAAGATNGPDFTATVGSEFSGGIVTSTGTLTLNSAASLAPGSTVKDVTGTTTYGTIVAKTSAGNWGVSGTTYSLSGNTTDVPASTTLRVYDILTVASGLSNSNLKVGDIITDSATNSTVYGTLGALGNGTQGALNSSYFFPNIFTFGSSQSLSSGTTIRVPSSAVAAAGTVLAVSSGNGVFPTATLQGTISATTLTVTSGTPRVGDALYGSNIKPGTRITRKLAGANDYGVTPSQVSGGTILARTAVRKLETTDPASGIPNPTPTMFVVSRKPSMNLSSSAQLCGGLCALLLPFSTQGSNTFTPFSVATAGSGLDWSSGFACLSNVDPLTIKFLGQVAGAKKTRWTELVQ